MAKDMEWKARECLRLVDEFIRGQHITCEETIYQTDRVIENAYDFIAALCGVAGYVGLEDDE